MRFPSLNFGWFAFLLLWGLSLGVVFGYQNHTPLGYLADFFLTFALIFTVQKYYRYLGELRFLREFHHLSQTMDDLRTLETKSPFDHILEAVVKIVGFDRSILFLKDPDGRHLRAVRVLNHNVASLEDLVLPREASKSLLWRVLDTAELVICEAGDVAAEENRALVEILKSGAVAMVPLVHQKNTLGVLLVDRHLSGTLISDDDLLQLQVLADQISIVLLNHSLHEDIRKKAVLLEEQNSRMNQELQFARVVQEGIFPRHPPAWEGLHLDFCFRSARVIGGDFFCFVGGCLNPSKHLCVARECEMCANHTYGILIGDVCGKGIPAALVMAVIHSLFREKIEHNSDPAGIMTQVNQVFKTYLGAETRFHASAFLGFFSPVDRKFSYASAGHDYPLLLRKKNRELVPLESTGTLLGLFRESEFTSRDVVLEPGDRVFFYTDGLTDLFEKTMNLEDGFEGAQKFLLDHADEDFEKVMGVLRDSSTSMKEEADDDITAILLEVAF